MLSSFRACENKLWFPNQKRKASFGPQSLISCILLGILMNVTVTVASFWISQQFKTVASFWILKQFQINPESIQNKFKINIKIYIYIYTHIHIDKYICDVCYACKVYVKSTSVSSGIIREIRIRLRREMSVVQEY